MKRFLILTIGLLGAATIFAANSDNRINSAACLMCHYLKNNNISSNSYEDLLASMKTGKGSMSHAILCKNLDCSDNALFDAINYIKYETL